MNITRPTIMEVDLDAFLYNVNSIKKYIGKDVELMPVIKANAYGTYINKAINIINQFDIVAVATVDEAVFLRKDGYINEIFVLNQPYKDEIKKILEYNIIIGLSSSEFLDEIIKLDKDIRVHIEVETGMGRTGVQKNNINKFINKIKDHKNIKVEGVYTHLSSADNDDEYTKYQLDEFNKLVLIAKEALKDIKYIHALASNGILNYSNKHYNLARIGMLLYGYGSNNSVFKNLNLRPVCKLKSKITFLKEVSKGVPISYSKTFITDRKTKVATIPIGYADGLKRALSNKGEVIINGEKAPIIGNVCMDSIMVDVTDIKNVGVWDDVYIWDNEIITIESIANICETINYEILSTISDRVPRVFKRKIQS